MLQVISNSLKVLWSFMTISLELDCAVSKVKKDSPQLEKKPIKYRPSPQAETTVAHECTPIIEVARYLN